MECYECGARCYWDDSEKVWECESCNAIYDESGDLLEDGFD